MKNLGAEANHKREWHRGHLEIWRENETLGHVIRDSLNQQPVLAVPFARLMMVEVVRNNFEDLFPEIKEAIEQSAFVGEQALTKGTSFADVYIAIVQGYIWSVTKQSDVHGTFQCFFARCKKFYFTVLIKSLLNSVLVWCNSGHEQQ